jgi:hypothetical protein
MNYTKAVCRDTNLKGWNQAICFPALLFLCYESEMKYVIMLFLFSGCMKNFDPFPEEWQLDTRNSNLLLIPARRSAAHKHLFIRHEGFKAPQTDAPYFRSF